LRERDGREWYADPDAHRDGDTHGFGHNDVDSITHGEPDGDADSSSNEHTHAGTDVDRPADANTNTTTDRNSRTNGYITTSSDALSDDNLAINCNALAHRHTAGDSDGIADRHPAARNVHANCHTTGLAHQDPAADQHPHPGVTLLHQPHFRGWVCYSRCEPDPSGLSASSRATIHRATQL
jgi:hypothetical protein